MNNSLFLVKYYEYDVRAAEFILKHLVDLIPIQETLTESPDVEDRNILASQANHLGIF